MTINYPDGTILNAVLLLHGDDTVRATVPGEDDVRTFTLANGGWISEKSEPVHIEFAWQRREQIHIPSEMECVCPTDLASRLISALRTGSDRSKPGSNGANLGRLLSKNVMAKNVMAKNVECFSTC